MKLLYLAAAFLLACFALAALAQTPTTPRVDAEEGAKHPKQTA